MKTLESHFHLAFGKKEKKKTQMESPHPHESYPILNYNFNLSQECDLLAVSLKFPAQR